MTFDYKNKPAFPRYNSFETNNNSNLINKFESKITSSQKNNIGLLSNGRVMRDLTNIPMKNNKLNSSLFKSRLDFSDKPLKINSKNEKLEESDYFDDSWDVEDSNELCKDQTSYTMPSISFESRSSHRTSSSNDSPDRNDNYLSDGISKSSLSLFFKDFTMEQSSSDEYSSMDCGNSSNSAASSSVNTKRLSKTETNSFSSPSKYAPTSNYNTPVSNKRSIHKMEKDAFDNNSQLKFEQKIIFEDVLKSSKSTKVPEAPSKKKRINPNSFAYKAMDLTTKDVFEYSTENQVNTFQIKPTVLGKGCYCEVFEIASSDFELVPGFSNEQILFKRYHKEVIEKRRENVEKFINNSLDQYNLLTKDNFPIAKIFNATTAKVDAFFLVERIPHEFKINWNKDTAIESLDEISLSCLKQVKWMFQYSFDNNIKMDLSNDNVRLNDDGKIILIDFMEENQGKFREVAEKHIETFARGNENIKTYLRPEGYVMLT
ncbi:MAG TPA: hypothetical protein VGP47_04725 [Parachlamydiaceae bacterium]|nr:hypothetical protein [Parachlamydiaceae bacterium]